jgi:hypothetical protein
MARTISMGARREVLWAVAERYRSAGRVKKGRILDALCRTTGWHRKHAVRALRRRVVDEVAKTPAPRERKRRYGATIKDAVTALWEASNQKRAGKTITPKERPRGENVVDLMEALRRSVGGAAAEIKAPKKSAKKPRKAAAGQKEMLMPIEGKKPKEAAAKKPAPKPQRKSA